MNKSRLFSIAHKIAKKMEGDYSVRLSYALKLVHELSKKVNEKDILTNDRNNIDVKYQGTIEVIDEKLKEIWEEIDGIIYEIEEIICEKFKLYDNKGAVKVKELKGTEKQIRYANDLMNKLNESINKNEEILNKIISFDTKDDTKAKEIKKTIVNAYELGIKHQKKSYFTVKENQDSSKIINLCIKNNDIEYLFIEEEYRDSIAKGRYIANNF